MTRIKNKTLIKSNKECYEFVVISNLIDTNNTVIKSNIRSKAVIELRVINSIRQEVNNKGNIRRNYCTIYHDIEGPILIQGKYNDLKEIIYPLLVAETNSNNSEYIGFNKVKNGKII